MLVNTIEEIKDQPNSWDSTVNYLIKNRQRLKERLDTFSDAVYTFAGCGSSYYLSLSGSVIFMNVTGELARAVPSSEVILYNQTIFPQQSKNLVYPISRSGNTTETVRAAQNMKNHDIETLGLTCSSNSELASICDHTLVASDAAEKSVVMTKSFTSMLLMIQLLAGIKAKNKTYIDQLNLLPGKGEDVIDKYEKLAKELSNQRDIERFIFLGQGPYYGLACESMLKMKEMSLSVSEAFHTLEFRHGPISVVNSNTLVTFLISELGEELELKVLEDVKKLGAKTLVICERLPKTFSHYADYVVELNSRLPDISRLNLYMPITQLLASHRALNKGLDPDNPRHLSQVVVLEQGEDEF